MTTNVDIERLLDGWMADGPPAMPEGTPAAVADRIAAQPQRVTWRVTPRLALPMPYMRVAVAVVAVVAVLVVGFGLVPNLPVATAPSLSPSPTERGTPPLPAGSQQPSSQATPTPNPTLDPTAQAPGSTLAVCQRFFRGPAFGRDADGEFVGYNLDLAEELAARLGLEPTIRLVEEQGLKQAFQGGSCDIAFASQVITTSAQVDFNLLPYLESESQGAIYASEGVAGNITSLTDLCGSRVVAATGSVYGDMIMGGGAYEDTGLNDNCRANHRAPLSVWWDGPPYAPLIGQAEARLGDSGLEDMYSKADVALPPIYLGIATSKENGELFDDISSAFDAMVADGTYREILARHLTADEVDALSIDGATPDPDHGELVPEAAFWSAGGDDLGWALESEIPMTL